VTTRTLYPSVAGGLAIRLSVFALPSPRAEEPVSFIGNIKPIFDTNCAGCHRNHAALDAS